MSEYEEKVIKLSKILNSYALKLTKNRQDADDLTQDTLISAILKESKFEVGTNLNAWLHKMMLNLFKDRLKPKIRKFDKLVESTSNESLVYENNSVNSVVSKLNIEVINSIINKLPYTQKKCFILYNEGYKYKEVSEMQNISIGAVMWSLNAAKKELKQQLKLLGYE
jgi:RNA polymerase sigma factor (sigma-70 family)